jgi:hypothetical protein
MERRKFFKRVAMEKNLTFVGIDTSTFWSHVNCIELWSFDEEYNIFVHLDQIFRGKNQDLWGGADFFEILSNARNVVDSSKQNYIILVKVYTYRNGPCFPFVTILLSPSL